MSIKAVVITVSDACSAGEREDTSGAVLVQLLTDLGEDFYDSFIEYQTRMLKVFDRMSGEYGFHVLNASRSVRSVAADLRRAVTKLLDEPATPVEDNVSPLQVVRDKPSTKPAANVIDLNKEAS